MKCTNCAKEFAIAKALSNHERWCTGKVKYRTNATYSAIHAWVRQRKPKPEFCVICGIKPPIDLANKSGQYLRDIDDYDYLCRSCHKIVDYTPETRAKISSALLEYNRRSK